MNIYLRNIFVRSNDDLVLGDFGKSFTFSRGDLKPAETKMVEEQEIKNLFAIIRHIYYYITGVDLEHEVKTLEDVQRYIKRMLRNSFP